MNSIELKFDASNLEKYSIARPVTDLGTLFPDDTRSQKTVKIFNYSNQHVCYISHSQITASSHAGTHADQPAHFMQGPGGHKVFSAHLYQGLALIIDLSGNVQRSSIDENLLEIKLTENKFQKGKHKILLLKTTAGPYPDLPQSKFAYLSPNAAMYLTGQDIAMVGIDTPSVDSPTVKDLSKSTHGILAQADIAIVENIDLSCHSGQGIVLTCFDPNRKFQDAHGISNMYFFETP